MEKITKILFFIFLCLFFSNLKAEILKDVKITGNTRVSEETIKIYGKIEKGKDYNDEDLNRILKDLYSTNFFEDITVEMKNSIIKINVKEYPVINQLIIIGEKKKAFKDQITKLLKLKEKRSFIKNYLSSEIIVCGVTRKLIIWI